MEKDVAIGSVGNVELKQDKGIASAKATLGPVSVLTFLKFSADVNAELDEVAMIKYLVEKHGPTGILGELLAAAEGALENAVKA